MLKVENLIKKYSTKKSSILALENISFEVQESDFISIIGPSGCGKSTLLRILASLDKQTSGEFHFTKNGTVIGFVSQNYALFPWLTVYENIAFGLQLKNISPEEIEKTVRRYLLITGLDKFKDSYPSQLSGGMKQRVAIVRTLANNPDIIFMDEPFGALDVQTRSQMQEFLVKVLKEEKKTVVMVTHDIEEAIYLSNKIVLLSTKPGTVKEIIEVSLPVPRKPELKNQPEFLELKKSISYALKSESIRSTTDEKDIPSNADLVIGSNIWTGITPMYLAQEKGIFSSYQIDPKIVTLEWSADRLDPLRDKRVDALNTTLDSALAEIARNPNVEIFMPLDYSFGGDAIISNKKYSSIEELKGKTIGVEKGWVGHFFLDYVLKKHRLVSADVVIKDLKVGDIGKELLLGTIDAASVQEPWLTKIREYGEFTTLKTTRDYGPLIYAVLLVNKDVLKEKQKQFNSFKKAWNESVQLLKTEPIESIRAVAPYLGLAEAELVDQLSNIEFSNLDKYLEAAIQEVRGFQ